MKTQQILSKVFIGLGFGMLSLVVSAQSMKVTLTGAQEVPPI